MPWCAAGHMGHTSYNASLVSHLGLYGYSSFHACIMRVPTVCIPSGMLKEVARSASLPSRGRSLHTGAHTVFDRSDSEAGLLAKVPAGGAQWPLPSARLRATAVGGLRIVTQTSQFSTLDSATYIDAVKVRAGAGAGGGVCGKPGQRQGCVRLPGPMGPRNGHQ